MISAGTAPSLPMHQCSPRNSTIVDGNISCVSPASSTNGMRSPNCWNTSSPLSHVGDPDKFALVPVNGTPISSINLRTTSCRGQRSATRPVFAVTFSGKRFDASTTIVNGPGQHFSAKR